MTTNEKRACAVLFALLVLAVLYWVAVVDRQIHIPPNVIAGVAVFVIVAVYLWTVKKVMDE
jgi:predicted membrane chloride channel (bestrophin family)